MQKGTLSHAQGSHPGDVTYYSRMHDVQFPGLSRNGIYVFPIGSFFSLRKSTDVIQKKIEPFSYAEDVFPFYEE